MSQQEEMASSHEIGALAEQLVRSITRAEDNKANPNTRSLRSSVDRSLKNHNFARTNQFEVAAKLEGLQEKFRVLNNDDLAEALQKRLDELAPLSTKWTPETLALLLQLSDNPVTKTRVEDLDALQNPEPAPPLTWEDLDASDPLPKHDAMWKDVDFAEESSDEEYCSFTNESPSSDEYLEEQSDTDDTSPGGPHEHIFTARGDEKLLKSITDAQFWNFTNRFDNIDLRYSWNISAGGKKVRLTELQIVKEFIFMLQGLPTSLFRKADGSAQLNISYSLRHSSEDVLHSLMESFAQIALRLDKVRAWVKLSQERPTLQTFQACVENHLFEFDSELSKIQARLLSPSEDVVVSLGALFRDVLKISKRVLNVEGVLSELSNVSKHSQFSLLELLYDTTCSYQAIGDESSYMLFAKLFLQCFQTYIRPIRRWVESGQLDADADASIIVLTRSTNSMNSLWRDWYQLKESSEGLNTPKFLQPVVKSLFTTGKSVLFLEQLGISTQMSSHNDDDRITFEKIWSSPVPMLTPFSELFENALENWFEERSQTISATLRQALDQHCGLWLSLNALEHIYFSRNLAISSSIDQRIFDRIDASLRDWNDRYLLTELARSAFGNLSCVSADSITVLPNLGRVKIAACKTRSVKGLAGFDIEYSLPWSVANIVTKSSMRIYQRIFTFLLQIRRAKYLLESQCLRLLQSAQPNQDRDAEALSYALRHRLLWFANSLYSYLSDLVLTTSTAKMRRSLARANDLDAMIEVHSSYIVKLEDQCLLSQQLTTIHRPIISILDLCIQYSDLQPSHHNSQGVDSKRKSSVSASSLQHLSNRHQKRRKSRAPDVLSVSDSSSSDGDHHPDHTSDLRNAGNENDVNTTSLPQDEKSYMGQLRQIRKEFDSHYAFITAGLRGIARAAGKQVEWESLAEKLEWKKDAGFVL